MLKKTLLVLGLVSAGLLLLIFNLTTPSRIGAIGLLGMFVLGYLFSLSTLSFLYIASEYILIRVLKTLKLKHPSKAVGSKKPYYYSSVLALGPVMLVGLHSVGGTNIYDVVLVLSFLVLGCFYVARRSI